MATQNDFLPFATGPGANVVDQATYAALAALTAGFVSGTAQSGQLNKVWRQSSIMSAVIAQFIVAQTGQAAVDDGTTPTLLANFTKAVNAASKQRVILTGTGSVNVLAAANAVPMTALPTVSGVVQTVAVKITNTGASTYSPDGLAARPIFGLGGAALQGGEMVANGIATLVSYVGPLLNGGALCWVLFECIGGAQQVVPATQSQHAVSYGQMTAYVAGSYLPLSGGVMSGPITLPNNVGLMTKATTGASFAAVYMDASNSITFGNASAGTQIVGSAIATSQAVTLGAPASAATHAVRADQCFGVQQAFVNVLPSRAMGTTYTNSTGKPITINVAAPAGGSGSAIGVFMSGMGESSVAIATAAAQALAVNAVVPPGASYVVQQSGPTSTLASWYEYR